MTLQKPTVYSSQSGKPVRIEYSDRGHAVRRGGSIDATDFHFYVDTGGDREHVQVAISGTAFYTIEYQLKGKNPTEEAVVDLAIDLATVRLLEAIDQGIDWDKDFAAFPN